VPFVDQYRPQGRDPSYNGSENCGPAVLTGIAKGRGLTDGLTDAAMLMLLAEVAGTTDIGTTGNGMVAGLDFLGLGHDAIPGCDLDWIDDELAAGHDIIAAGDFYSVPERWDPTKVSGHYIAVTGVRDDWSEYTVMDPAGSNVHTMTDVELQA